MYLQLILVVYTSVEGVTICSFLSSTPISVQNDLKSSLQWKLCPENSVPDSGPRERSPCQLCPALADLKHLGPICTVFMEGLCFISLVIIWLWVGLSWMTSTKSELLWGEGLSLRVNWGAWFSIILPSSLRCTSSHKSQRQALQAAQFLRCFYQGACLQEEDISS